MLICHNRIRVKIAPGFLLLLALFFYLDDGTGILQWVFFAAVIHEGGHIGASTLFGGKVEAVSMNAVGVELRFFYNKPLPYWKENIVALFGPAVNLAAGCILMWCGKFMPGAMSLSLGIFNLLPAFPLDGGRVLFNVTAEHFGLDVADCAVTVAGGICIGVITGLGAVAAIEYMNFTILFGAIWLFIVTTKNAGRKNAKK